LCSAIIDIFTAGPGKNCYICAKYPAPALVIYKGLLILQAIIKPLAYDEKNIPAFSEKKKK
jgi:hypothetical protein